MSAKTMRFPAMQRTCWRFMVGGLLAWSLLARPSPAALPQHAQVIQAESMACSGPGWTVRDHAPDAWYAGRPVGQMLGGQDRQPGTAAATFHIPAPGRYRIWIRYLDMVNYRSKSGFLLVGTQGETPVAKKDFDNTESSPRSTPEGEKKWGDGFARWIWDCVEFNAAQGALQVSIEKIHLASVHGCTRTLDLLLLTDDLGYEPAVTDLAPLYVKVRMLPEQKEPVVVHLWGRRPFSPWYTPHANINQQGLVAGIGAGSENRPDIRLAAGEESPWLDISPYLAYGGLNRLSLYAMRSYQVPEAEAHFEICWSKTASEAGLIAKAQRQGAGDGFLFAVDLVDYRLITETEGSAASLDMARATPDHRMTEMLRAGTDSAAAHLPGIPTTANFACELISGNLVSRCVDWYEIFATAALTTFEGMPLFCGTQQPYQQTFLAGQGKVIVVGFFPAISYIATSD